MDVSPIGQARPTPPKQSSNMADGLEQAFLSEMLKYAGPREASGQFGGGIGESQFSSFLNDAYAKAISERVDLKIMAKGGGSND